MQRGQTGGLDTVDKAGQPQLTVGAKTPLREKAGAGTTGPNWLRAVLRGPHMHPSHQYSPQAFGCSVKLSPLDGDQEGPVYT